MTTHPLSAYSDGVKNVWSSAQSERNVYLNPNFEVGVEPMLIVVYPGLSSNLIKVHSVEL